MTHRNLSLSTEDEHNIQVTQHLPIFSQLKTDEKANDLLLQAPPDRRRHSAYSREITIALLVKFTLLGALWWFLFAGNKQTMAEWRVAGKIFGAQQPAAMPAQLNQENP